MLHDTAILVVSSKLEMEAELGRAVAAAAAKASVRRSYGILVTRHDFSTFSVALSASVPYGLIREKDLAGR